jgi:starch synthase
VNRIAPAPRILVVTPEITYLPEEMGQPAADVSAKAGGMADVVASLVAGMFRAGVDVHVAMPNYRRIFGKSAQMVPGRHACGEPCPDCHVHLAEDRDFYYKDRIYSRSLAQATRDSMVFQREVIHQIIPAVKPDLVHCNDWMTSLIPAVAKSRGIRSLFTLHNVDWRTVTLADVEASGIDAAEFWDKLYYTRMPENYETTRSHIPLHLLASGIFAADHFNTVSPGFLREIVDGAHPLFPACVRSEIRHKHAAGRACGILNAPDPSYHPSLDPTLPFSYSEETCDEGKARNKQALQRALGLDVDPEVPVMFWPSRLDPYQKGPELLARILHRTVSDYWHQGLQFVFVADGPHQQWFRKITDDFSLHRRVAVRSFDERLSRLAYAGADFMLMPSFYEPCGLSQMIATIYGTLPVAHATGGLADTIRHLDPDASTGNGFRFEHPDSNGLRWAINQAMTFHAMTAKVRTREIRRIMRESTEEFGHAPLARRYMDVYESILGRELVPRPTRAAPQISIWNGSSADRSTRSSSSLRRAVSR